jgi:hypothetical protein
MAEQRMVEATPPKPRGSRFLNRIEHIDGDIKDLERIYRRRHHLDQVAGGIARLRETLDQVEAHLTRKRFNLP